MIVTFFKLKYSEFEYLGILEKKYLFLTISYSQIEQKFRVLIYGKDWSKQTSYDLWHSILFWNKSLRTKVPLTLEIPRLYLKSLLVITSIQHWKFLIVKNKAHF